MWTYHPDLLAQPAPRYTSYPTAADFHEAVGPDDLDAALDGIADEAAVSLYLHIPFCRDICWYCGCDTGAANRSARLDAYLARLEQELAMVATRLEGRGRVRRIAFGGGSPNAMPPGAFLRLVEQIATRLPSDGSSLSVEIDPRGFDQPWATALADAGASRVSLGVQTFDPALQAAIGRVQPEDQIRRSVAMLRDAGVESINVDLMYGLPGQDAASLSATIETALSMGPERLAVFGYAHVPHLIPRQRRIDDSALPDAEARFEQAALAHAMLRQAGYAAVGFDHFALPTDALAMAAADGTLRRNFQGFTEDQADVLIGLGASAISLFPDRILQNEKNSGRWHMAIGAGRFATARGIHRTAEDRLRGRAIEQLLCQGAADIAPLLDPAALRAALLPFEQRGLVTWCDARVEIAPDALPFARVIAARIDRYRSMSSVRFSNAV